jgi:peptide/nickel transport system substrate-binding protein
MKKRIVVLIVAALVIIVVAGVANYFLMTPPAAPKVLTYYSQYDIQSLDPADAYDSGSFIPLQNCYETLVTYPVQNITTLIPDLATSWNISSDGLVYTFSLRQNVKFSNGDPLTSADVVYTFQRILTMNSPSSGVAWIDSQEFSSSSIKALDPYTVQFTLTHPFSPFLQTLATVEPNGIVDKAVVEAHGGVVANQDNSYMAANATCTGPYIIQSWTRSQQVVMVENPTYWRGWSGPHYDKVVMLLNQQPSTAISAAKSGDATIADIPFDQAPSLANATNFKIESSSVPRTKLMTFNLDSAHSFMSDQNVRVALSWAFPYDDVIKDAFKGYADQLNGPVPAQIYLGQESMSSKYYSYDLQKAASILDQAGYTKGANGLRFSGTALILYSESTQAWATTIDQLYQSALSQIGIVTDIHSVPPSTVYGARKTNNWDLMIVTWGPDYNDPSDYALPFVGSAAIGGDTYSTHYNNTAIDSAILDGMQTQDTTKEIADYKTVWNQANSNPSMIFMAVTTNVAAVSNTLSNYSYNAIITYNFYFYTPV